MNLNGLQDFVQGTLAEYNFPIEVPVKAWQGPFSFANTKDLEIYFNVDTVLSPNEYFQVYMAVHEATHLLACGMFGEKVNHDARFMELEKRTLKSLGINPIYTRKGYAKKLIAHKKVVFAR